jgi:hypothetical protein
MYPVKPNESQLQTLEAISDDERIVAYTLRASFQRARNLDRLLRSVAIALKQVPDEGFMKKLHHINEYHQQHSGERPFGDLNDLKTLAGANSIPPPPADTSSASKN